MHIAQLMAQVMIGSKCEEIKTKGYITVCEPTCGSGVMVMAVADALRKNYYSPSQNMCVLAVDNDIRCAMMAYIQLSYLGIPAVVIHGDSSLVKEYTRFYTPIYILGGWLWKEPMSLTNRVCDDDIKLRNIMLDFMDKFKNNNDLASETEGGKKNA